MKRLTTLATIMAPHQAIATLALVRHVMQRYPRTSQLLDAEVARDGVYLPTVTEPEHCNALAATLWEAALLTQHWHPTVAKHALELLSGKLTLLPQVTLQALRELVHTLDVVARGTFAPPVRLPSTAQQKRSAGAHALVARTGTFNPRQPMRRTPSLNVPPFVDENVDDSSRRRSSSKDASRVGSFRRQFANAVLRRATTVQRALLARLKRMKKH